VEVLPVTGIGEVTPGADLADLIATAAPWLRDGDVVVVTSKIVSKAEGRLVMVSGDPAERERARQEAVAAETARTVASRGATRIVATHHGFVMAAAGVDASNVEPHQLALLPKDPDASARALRAALARRLGVRVAVVISDTTGRPWRNGLTDVALGAAGVEPIRDYRGHTDPYGNQLQLTQTAVVDELAAAADLVKGKTDRVPVAVVRGLPVVIDEDGPGVVASLVRDPDTDLFPLGTAEARADGLRRAATLPSGEEVTGPADPDAVRRAVATVAAEVATFEPAPTGATVRCTVDDPSDPVTLVRLGADVHRLRAALAAEGLASSVTYEAGAAVVTVGHPAGSGAGRPASGRP
jgi:coenzyme F420-0:L-glutamate ligase/coenzyme F420-1:gamma-L-glutamate ligase